MKQKGFFSVIYMFVLTLIFTSAVSGVYVINKDRIALNDRLKLQRIILRVLAIQVPENTPDEQMAQIFDNKVRTREWEGHTVYVGLAEDGKTVEGYAFPLYGAGFWGPIDGMMGVDPKLETVLGIAFYRHTETPGLGGRIAEQWFSRKFEGKKIRDAGPDQEYFVFKPPGMASEPYEVDAITGASGTSHAVEKFLNANLRDYLALIKRNTEGGKSAATHGKTDKGA